MQRRIFSREYKLEAVKLVRERVVTVPQAARELDVHENVLRKWAREYGDDPSQSLPGKGQMKLEQLEIEWLRREVAKLNAYERTSTMPAGIPASHPADGLTVKFLEATAMSELLDNAIHSIQLGIEDYQSNDDRRPISALRNFYAGVLLLGKECLLQTAPDADPMEVLASRYTPSLDGDGNLVIRPKGQTTIDLHELRERFGGFGLTWPDGNIKDLQKLRNDFEHYHSKAPKETIRQAIAACFPLVEGFFSILELSPASMLGTTWDIMLAERAFFNKQKAACDATLEKLPWWDNVWDSSHFQCTTCNSSLIYQEDAGNKDPAMVRGHCKACAEAYTAEETTAMIVQSLYGADDYLATKDGGEQVIHNCPECSVEAYVESSEFTGCFFCEHSIDDTCARCSIGLTVANQSVNNSSLCDYCDHVSSRAD